MGFVVDLQGRLNLDPHEIEMLRKAADLLYPDGDHRRRDMPDAQELGRMRMYIRALADAGDDL